MSREGSPDRPLKEKESTRERLRMGDSGRRKEARDEK